MKTNLLIFFTSTFFFLGTAEIGIRTLFSKPEFSERFLFWSSPLFELQEDRTVHHTPHTYVREVAVYDNKVEYDISFQTNNYGLIDHKDYSPDVSSYQGKKRFVFVGDSFTAGAGGGPWVPELRDRVEQKGIEIFNLGMCGSSIEHFFLSLKHFSEHLPFQKIVLLAISDDFHRLYWWPLTNSSEIRMCPDGESQVVCQKRTPMATVIDSRSTEQEILEVARETKLQQRKKSSVLLSPFLKAPDQFLSHSRLYSLASKYFQEEPLFALAEKKQSIGKPLKYYIENKNFESLAEIRKTFPEYPIYFIHLPEKEEIKKQQYKINLKKRVSKENMEYFPALTECNLSLEMFHKNDTHPNFSGYQEISRCVEEYLF